MSAGAALHFDGAAADLAARYDSVAFEEVHGAIERYLPAPPAAVLDIGAGSGRDARALARLGYDVTAVEPSASFRRIAAATPSAAPIDWIDERLPRLASLAGRSGGYRFILCSAVLMYLPSRDLDDSFATMARLLDTEGVIAISVRDPAPDEPRSLIHRHSSDRLLASARRAGLELVERGERGDALGRERNRWRSFVFAPAANQAGGSDRKSS